MFVLWRLVDVQKDFADSDTAIQQRDDDKSSFLCTVYANFNYTPGPSQGYQIVPAMCQFTIPQGLIDTPGAGSQMLYLVNTTLVYLIC